MIVEYSIMAQLIDFESIIKLNRFIVKLINNLNLRGHIKLSFIPVPIDNKQYGNH